MPTSEPSRYADVYRPLSDTVRVPPPDDMERMLADARQTAPPAEGTPEGVDVGEAVTRLDGWLADPQRFEHMCPPHSLQIVLAALAAERSNVRQLLAEAAKLREAIAEHHRQKADDRCIEDDDRLYAAAKLPPCDRRVGSKEAMMSNCRRFIDRRCEGGGWLSYVELESQLAAALADAAHWRAVAEASEADRDALLPAAKLSFNLVKSLNNEQRVMASIAVRRLAAGAAPKVPPP